MNRRKVNNKCYEFDIHPQYLLYVNLDSFHIHKKWFLSGLHVIHCVNGRNFCHLHIYWEIPKMGQWSLIKDNWNNHQTIKTDEENEYAKVILLPLFSSCYLPPFHISSLIVPGKNLLFEKKKKKGTCIGSVHTTCNLICWRNWWCVGI